MPIPPENFNRIRDANARYGVARESLGVVRAVAEASPTEANTKMIDVAELEVRRALKEFNRALGAADLRPSVPGG